MSHERPLSVVRYGFPQVLELRRIQWFDRYFDSSSHLTFLL